MSRNRPALNSQIDDPASWVDRYGDALYRFALSRVEDPSLAEDLVQETFLAALKARQNFQGRSTARTWLIAILKHKIVDHIRKRVREPISDKVESLSDAAANDPVDDNFKNDGAWRQRPSQWAVNPMKLYEQKEFMDVLYRCLADLPERQAEAFMMREIDGLSTEEICKALNISATNSWVMLYRARMLLRHCIENQWLVAES
ncbi:MAG: sigma-70 family RNA polymerase sigma factor [Desulfobacterales bacterium]|nr:MAG: sigma-70 family RNA polymerase sigma factor [Desulfobacterales bacterium]